MTATVASANMLFKLFKMWRNYRDWEELQRRQSPAALQEEVARAVEALSFEHAHKVMTTNEAVGFVLEGAPSGMLHGEPVKTLDLLLRPDQAPLLLRACDAAAEVALQVKIGGASGTADLEIHKVCSDQMSVSSCAPLPGYFFYAPRSISESSRLETIVQ